jgi:hypothetical protein
MVFFPLLFINILPTEIPSEAPTSISTYFLNKFLPTRAQLCVILLKKRSRCKCNRLGVQNKKTNTTFYCFLCTGKGGRGVGEPG